MSSCMGDIGSLDRLMPAEEMGVGVVEVVGVVRGAVRVGRVGRR